MSEAGHLDRVAVQELQGVMGADFAFLVETFAKDSAMRIAALRSASAANDADALRRAAHSFKGSSGNMGAPQLAEQCRVLEELGRSGSALHSDALIDALEREYVGAQNELNALLG